MLVNSPVRDAAGWRRLAERLQPEFARAPKRQEKQLYTCGMHPQVIQDHPGNCPICGMKLTPDSQTDAAETRNAAAIPPPSPLIR